MTAGAMAERTRRAELIRHLGATPSEVNELLDYGDRRSSAFASDSVLPDSGDEPFVDTWRTYQEEARERGVWTCLRSKLVQLRFPIERGISECAAYRGATRRGILPPDGTGSGLRLTRPDELQLFLHVTPVGRIPVILTANREDFISLVQAIVHRNEPERVPGAMGACMVAGYNNWDRLHALGRGRVRGSGSEVAGGRGVLGPVPDRRLYQDRFILLSPGPYSAVPAGSLNLRGAEWQRLSLAIRLEHESAHYVMLRLFSSVRNHLLDELIADYFGLTVGTGRYRPGWLLHFMGLEGFPAYRAGGRLELYRGQPPLSDGAFAVLQRLLVLAAWNLQRIDAQIADEVHHLPSRIRAFRRLAALSLEELAVAPTAPLRDRPRGRTPRPRPVPEAIKIDSPRINPTQRR